MPRQIFWVVPAVLFQVPVVILLFRFLPTRVAASIAGALFCALGLWILLLGLKDSRWRKGLAFWVNLPFLFVFSLPLWLMSLTQTGRGLVHWELVGYPFYFVPVQVLHSYASFFFRALVILLLADFFRFLWLQKQRIPHA